MEQNYKKPKSIQNYVKVGLLARWKCWKLQTEQINITPEIKSFSTRECWYVPRIYVTPGIKTFRHYDVSPPGRFLCNSWRIAGSYSI